MSAAIPQAVMRDTSLLTFDRKPQQGGPPMNGQMLSQVRQQTQMPDLQALSQNGPASVGMPG